MGSNRCFSKSSTRRRASNFKVKFTSKPDWVTAPGPNRHGFLASLGTQLQHLRNKVSSVIIHGTTQDTLIPVGASVGDVAVALSPLCPSSKEQAHSVDPVDSLMPLALARQPSIDNTEDGHRVASWSRVDVNKGHGSLFFIDERAESSWSATMNHVSKVAKAHRAWSS